jgi:undecaprenyl-diphosphatase
MGPLQALVLGTIQGLTEFLPISSSGHLVISQQLFGLRESALLFDISVHIGTLMAVIIYFWEELRAIMASVVRGLRLLLKREASLTDIYEDSYIKLVVFIAVGSIPTAILGLWFQRVSDELFSSVRIVGSMLVVTGVLLSMTGFLLWSTHWIHKKGGDISQFSIKKALLVGLVQGVAIIPGISRSGATIAGGLFLGLDKETAAKYSFLLSIPAILGAGILIFKDIHSYTTVPLNIMLIGCMTSGIVGYCALRFLVHIVKKGQLHFFAPYCWLAGVTALIYGL